MISHEKLITSAMVSESTALPFYDFVRACGQWQRDTDAVINTLQRRRKGMARHEAMRIAVRIHGNCPTR